MIIALLLEETKTFGFKLRVNTIQGQVFNTVVGKSPYKSYSDSIYYLKCLYFVGGLFCGNVITTASTVSAVSNLLLY